MASCATIEEVEMVDRAMLVPEHIARIMHMDPQAIRVFARDEKRAGREPFPFPTVLYGENGVVRFPKHEFLEWAKRSYTTDNKSSSHLRQMKKTAKGTKCRPVRRQSVQQAQRVRYIPT